MSIKKTYAKTGSLLFYGDAEYNTFSVFEEDKHGNVSHLLTYYVKNGEQYCRENGESTLKPIKELSVKGEQLLSMGTKILGVKF